MIKSAVLAFGILFASQAFAQKPETSSLPMLTIHDPGRPFTVIDGGCSTSTYPQITLADGFNQTLNNAIKSAAEQGRRMGASAMIGMDVSWETPTSTGQKGRVLVCGTYIKYK